MSLLIALKESGCISVLADTILQEIARHIVIIRRGVGMCLHLLAGIHSGMRQVLMVMIVRKVYLNGVDFSNDVGADITIYYSDSLAA